MDLEEGDVVLCTVDRIVGTTVFVKIHLNGKEKEGSIIFSEIAPGRIRNIRSYVVPKKKIVCKVLRISGNQIELSYRRVTQEERKEVLSEHKKEKSYENMLKSILGKDKAEKIIDKIKEENNLYDFFQSAKEKPKMLNNIMGEKEAERVLEVLSEEKPKKIKISKKILLKTSHEEGLKKIKDILGILENDVEVKYLSGGKYTLEKEAENAKKADNELEDALKRLEDEAKKYNMTFDILKK